MRRKITDLREQRATVLAQMREISDGAEAERRDLTAEETQAYERQSTEFDALGTRIERLEREAGLTDQLSRTVAPSDGEGVVKDRHTDEPVTQRASYTRAFEALVRARGHAEQLPPEQRAELVVGTDAQGGFLVPDEFFRQIVAKAQEVSNVRQLATVITTAENGDVLIPKEGGFVTVTWMAEGAAYTESEPTFAQVVLKAYKAGLIAKVSDELIDDSAFDILGFLANRLGIAFGKETNKQYVNGASGSTTTPKGVVNKASTGVTAAANNAITADEVIDLFHSVIDPYRSNGVWLARDATIKAVRKLKETTNQYLWQPGLQAGQPDSLLGRPVLVTPDVPAMATTAKSLVFGDLSGYWIRDVSTLNVKVLSELYAANGYVGVRADLRTDGDLVDTDSCKVLAHPV